MMYGTKALLNNSDLSTEMIKEQNGDYIVEVLNIGFRKIVKLYNDLGLTNVKFFRNRDVKVTMQEIDSALNKRFGIHFKHINATGIGYGVFTAPPKQYNILNKDITVLHSDTKDYLNAVGKRGSNAKNEVDDYASNEADVLYKWMKSVDAIDEQFRKDGISINLEKARIDNLPKDYLVYIGVDFDMLIGKAGLTGTEITAALLHEVGHAFTHIEYSYRTVNNTAVITDSLKGVVDGDMSYKKAMKLSYAKLGGDPKDVEDSNAISITLNVVDTYARATSSMDKANTHTTTDSEQLADQFSGKFGVQAELSQALGKLSVMGVELTNQYAIECIGVLYATMLFYALIATASISGAIVVSGAIIATIFGIGALLASMSEIYTAGGNRNGIVYDNDYRRQKRIRNEVVRQLRSADLPKGVIKEHISYLDIIDSEMVKTSKDSTSTLAKIGIVLFKTNRDAADTKEVDELIEDMMENELYVSANKLKTL